MLFSAHAPFWAYIAGRPGYLAGLVRLSAGLYGTLQSCPALALLGIPPSLAVTCPFRAAYVPHAHVFPWCQRLYFPQGLGWTRTSDTSITRHFGLLYLLSYKSIWSPDGEEDAPPGDWKGKREKKAREPALYSHAYIVKQVFGFLSSTFIH